MVRDALPRYTRLKRPEKKSPRTPLRTASLLKYKFTFLAVPAVESSFEKTSFLFVILQPPVARH